MSLTDLLNSSAFELFTGLISVPLIVGIVAFIMYKFPPKKINRFIGYRSSNSRKSQETWDFAQKYCAKLFYKISLIIMIPSIAAVFIFKNQPPQNIERIIGIAAMIQVLIILSSNFFVEKALGENFDDEGRRIQ